MLGHKRTSISADDMWQNTAVTLHSCWDANSCYDIAYKSIADAGTEQKLSEQTKAAQTQDSWFDTSQIMWHKPAAVKHHLGHITATGTYVVQLVDTSHQQEHIIKIERGPHLKKSKDYMPQENGSMPRARLKKYMRFH